MSEDSQKAVESFKEQLIKDLRVQLASFDQSLLEFVISRIKEVQ